MDVLEVLVRASDFKTTSRRAFQARCLALASSVAFICSSLMTTFGSVGGLSSSSSSSELANFYSFFATISQPLALIRNLFELLFSFIKATHSMLRFLSIVSNFVSTCLSLCIAYPIVTIVAFTSVVTFGL